MFNKYYQDELTYLRQLGQEFAAAYPQVGHMLAESGTDPDVERLLEGFAFLAGRIRQRLDSELPELTHAFVGLLWPHYLRPVPSASIVQFEPAGTLQDLQVIPKGTELDSVPVEGTRCRFRTSSDVRLYPFVLADTTLDIPLTRPATLTLQFSVSEKANLAEMAASSLRLFLHGEMAVVPDLYLWLVRHTRALILAAGDRQIRVDHPSVTPGGFTDADALLPYPPDALPGYRLIQEFFTLPEKFLFVDIGDISAVRHLGAEKQFRIVIEFAQRPPDRLRVQHGMVRIGCTPVVNLMSLRSSPIRVEHDKTEYRLRADTPSPEHYEVFSVDRVVGWMKGTVKEREYQPFYSYHYRNMGNEARPEFYQIHLRPSVVGRGTDTYLSFVAGTEPGVMPSTETVAADLTCTNRNLCEKIRPGDISVATSQSPPFATFRNVARVTVSVPPPLEGRLLWRLISNLSLNYLSLLQPEHLRAVLSLYNFHGMVDRQAARIGELRLMGLKAIRAKPEDMLRHGVTYRGVEIDLDVQEDAFASEGELYVFMTVLNHFMSLYATMNCFTRLKVRGLQQGGVYEWPPMLGQQILL